MLETDPSFRPARAREGCPPLEDLGLIGDGATVALAGLDGSLDASLLALPLRSHIGVIASGVTLARALAATGGHASTAGAPA